jgi:hypothetical protein
MQSLHSFIQNSDINISTFFNYITSWKEQASYAKENNFQLKVQYC